MKIEPNILSILDAGRTEGNLYFLPVGQLERKVYLDVNKVLEALGGKWNKKAKAHVFEQSIEEAINNVILTGEVTSRKKELQFFETPYKVADQLVELAELRDDSCVLEPSAGRGKIIQAIERNRMRASNQATIRWCELDQNNVNFLLEYLCLTGFQGNDFLKVDPCSLYITRIIMNPPFSMNGAGSQTDIDHVTHALKFLASGGILVSVMSPAIKFRTNRKTNEFRESLSNYRHEIIDLPENAFKESGTTIKTVVLKVWKGSKS